MPKEVSDRLEYELSTIEQLSNAGTHADYASFFLFVRDYVEATRRMGAWVGPGRGALAGSAVAHALGITGVDPIKHGLLFERFLNLDRISMPNIDIEFDDEGRGEVQQYIAERYGRDHVAHIVTFGLMSPKRAIDVKIGLLGSATLAIQKECVRLIKERTGKTIDLEHIPENDEATLSVFAKSNKKFRIGKWESEDEARRLIDKTWGDWYAFASHAFNKSHAVACAWHAYQSAYLKAHYPKEFLCARVRQECGNPDAIERIICGDG